MENFPKISGPVALVRPPGAHRLEAFSLKLGRRLTFYRRALLDLWLLLEGDPSVIAFCERPGYVHRSVSTRLADFWVQYSDRQELVLLADGGMETRAGPAEQELDGAAFPIRSMSSADLAAARIWIGNWQRMLPCIVLIAAWSLGRFPEKSSASRNTHSSWRSSSASVRTPIRSCSGQHCLAYCMPAAWQRQPCAPSHFPCARRSR